MAVNISVNLADGRNTYGPGEMLRGTVRIDLGSGEVLKKAELSVLWVTEGKGDTDMGVIALRELDPQVGPEYPLEAALPLLPLSYNGHLLKIHWLIRVRANVSHQPEAVYDYPFTMASPSPAVSS